MGRIFYHVLAYPDQSPEKSCKGEGGGGGGGEGEFARIEHAAKQQLTTSKNPLLLFPPSNTPYNPCRERLGRSKFDILKN